MMSNIQCCQSAGSCTTIMHQNATHAVVGNNTVNLQSPKVTWIGLLCHCAASSAYMLHYSFQYLHVSLCKAVMQDTIDRGCRLNQLWKSCSSYAERADGLDHVFGQDTDRQAWCMDSTSLIMENDYLSDK